MGQAFKDSFALTVHCKAINEEIREEKDCLHCSQFSVYKDKVEVCDWLNPSDNITFLTSNPLSNRLAWQKHFEPKYNF